MIYRTFTFSLLPENLQTEDIKETLIFSDSGAVAPYYIDDDYMLLNNSNITIVADTTAVAGQIIVLIETSGVYALGVITAVDNEQKQITYRSLLSLFDDNILNFMRGTTSQELQAELDIKKLNGEIDQIEALCSVGLVTKEYRDQQKEQREQQIDNIKRTTANIQYLYDAVDDTARILRYNFTGNIDKYRRIPLVFRSSGGGKNSDGDFNVPAVWSNRDNEFNARTWLIELFDTHNVVIQPRLVFEVSRAYVELYIFKNTTGGKLIKNNIPGMVLTHTEESSPRATVCQVIYSKDKAIAGLYFLLADNTVTNNAAAPNRVQPYRLTVAEFDADEGAKTIPPTTPQIIAENALKYKDFSHYISIIMDRNSRAFPKDLQIGDSVTVVPTINEMEQDTPIMTPEKYEQYTISTIYTGRKENSSNSRVTMTFGKIRINYTDLIQIERYRRVRA